MATINHSRNSSSLSSTAPFIVAFFGAMVLHEIALEGITAVYGLPQQPATSCDICDAISIWILRATSFSALFGDVIQNFPRTRAELKIYILLSVVVYGATAFATMSLGYDGVIYVTKVVFKSAKLIPTMLVGVLLDARAARLGQAVKKKNYGVYEYSSALLLSAGAAGFCMNANNIETDLEETDVSNDSSTSMIGGHVMGLLLLTASVFCDAIVPNIQEKLMNGNSLQSTNPQSNQIDVEIKPFIRNENTAQPTSSSTQKGMSSLSLMVNTNAIGFTMLLLTATLSASIVTITSNIIKHPHYFLLLLTVGVGLSSAVLAYTELIRRSGPAVAVAVATLRKVVTVVLSYIIFPKAMSWTHVMSSGLVLLGLLVGFVGRGRK
ncbi:hypothetical protein ACHAXN_009866 [Cyclotella atomus]